MTLHTRACCIWFAATAIGLHAPAFAQPGKWATSENPLNGATKQGPMKATSTYGMCSGPQNADASAQSPVPVVEGKCDNSQTFSATSLGPSTGNGCGGFTVAFGPDGTLRPHLDHVILKAEWGDVPLNAANCASAKISTVGWGARCTGRANKTASSLTTACESAQWEKIGGPTQGKGVWNTTTQGCDIGVQLNSIDKKYKTLTMDIIATVVENGQTVRKRATGTIWAREPNGQCFSATTKPKRKE